MFIDKFELLKTETISQISQTNVGFNFDVTDTVHKTQNKMEKKRNQNEKKQQKTTQT